MQIHFYSRGMLSAALRGSTFELYNYFIYILSGSIRDMLDIEKHREPPYVY